MTDTPLKTLNPFDIPPPPPLDSDAENRRADAIGARNGFDVPRPAPKAARPKPKPKPKSKPKPKPPEVRRMRTRTTVPKAQFNQRVPVHVANGFYDYQRETGLPMGTVLQRAYEALIQADGKGEGA